MNQMEVNAEGNDAKININVLSKIRCTCKDNCICPFFKKKQKDCLYCSNIDKDDIKTPENSYDSKKEED